MDLVLISISKCQLITIIWTESNQVTIILMDLLVQQHRVLILLEAISEQEMTQQEGEIIS